MSAAADFVTYANQKVSEAYSFVRETCTGLSWTVSESAEAEVFIERYPELELCERVTQVYSEFYIRVATTVCQVRALQMRKRLS
jgi:hypothetical protein